MNLQKVSERLKEIIVELKNNEITVDAINETTNLVTETGVDSLQLINLFLSIEDEFGIEIDYDNFDISYLNNFSTLCNFIYESIEKKSQEDVNRDALLLDLTSV